MTAIELWIFWITHNLSRSFYTKYLKIPVCEGAYFFHRKFYSPFPTKPLVVISDVKDINLKRK